MNNLYQIIYISSSRTLLDHSQLLQLLTTSRAANQVHGITGMLLYKNGSFMQVIEGPLDNLQQLYTKITNDAMHTGIIELIREPIAQRDFADWSMGFQHIPSAAVDGFSDIFNRPVNTTNEASAAKTLLLSFRNT